MSSTAFNWPKLISEMNDESCGIPTDVVFQIFENGQFHEIKAHKTIFAIVSPTFKTMFYSTDVGDRTTSIIRIEKTTALAFRIMRDAVYNVRSIGESLEGKTVHEVFDVVNLLERYQIKELLAAAQEHLSNFPITNNNVLEVAGDAMEYANMFKDESRQLLLTCATFLKPKLKDANAMIEYAAGNEDKKEEFATLLARMKDIVPTVCSNCGKDFCQDGKAIKDDEFRVGLVVTNDRANRYWRNIYCGKGRITKVEDEIVTLESVEPLQPRYSLDGIHDKSTDRGPMFLFYCI